MLMMVALMMVALMVVVVVLMVVVVVLVAVVAVMLMMEVVVVLLVVRIYTEHHCWSISRSCWPAVMPRSSKRAISYARTPRVYVQRRAVYLAE